MLFIVLGASVLAAVQGGVPRAVAEKGAVNAAQQIVEAARSKTPAGILAHVAQAGIPCVDSVVPRQHVEKELNTKGTWYYAYFFDATVFNQRFRDGATPSSLAELVGKGNKLHYRVQFQQYPTAPAFDYPCVFVTGDDAKDKEVLCFYTDGGQWWLRDGPRCD